MPGADHHRYEELAVGHVLGGLDPVEAADFRSHLITCRDCRMRVAELRDIASELAAAEREERMASRVKMETARREEQEQEADEPTQPRFPGGGSGAAVVIGLVVLVGLLFWNFHLRDVNATLIRVTQAQEEVLAILGEGTPVGMEMVDGRVSGQGAVAGERLALDLVGLPPLRATESLTVWFLDDDGEASFFWRFGPGEVTDGRFAVHGDHRDAAAFEITIERGSFEGRTGPSGDPLVRGSL